MIYICCVDDYASLSFNKRRNSSDRFVIEDIINTVGEAPLRVDTYTAKLFRDKQVPLLIVDDDCLENAKDGEFVFVERQNPSAYLKAGDQLILYHWNRHYPSDNRLNLTGWNALEITTGEFAGYSHEKITKTKVVLQDKIE